MRYAFYLTIAIIILVSGGAAGSSLQGRQTLVLKFGTNPVPELREPEWTPQQSVLDLDIGAVNFEADGATLVLGRTEKNGEQKLVVARYLADGSLDTSFGTKGAVYLGSLNGSYRDQKIVRKTDRIDIEGSLCLGVNRCIATHAELFSDGSIKQNLTHDVASSRISLLD